MPVYPGVLAMLGASNYGLVEFGNGSYYSIPHDAILDLGAGAWAWFAWTKVDTNPGSAYQYLLSSGIPGGVPSFVLYLGEASAAILEEQNRFVARIVDDAGLTPAPFISSAATGADGVTRLVVVQSTGTTLEMWLCPAGGTATRVVNSATNFGALTAPVAWNFGRRTDGDVNRYWEELAGGLGKANVALSQANIEAIAAGQHPLSVLGANLAEYWSYRGKLIGSNETGEIAGTVATHSTAAAPAAISFGTLSRSIITGLTSASPSHSHAVDTGVSHLLGIGLFGDPFNISGFNLSAFTHGASSLLANPLVAIQAHPEGDSYATHFVYLLTAPSGTQTLAYTMSNSTWGRALVGLDLKNVANFNVVKPFTLVAPGANSISTTVTSTAANSVLLMIACIGKNAQGGLVVPGTDMNELDDFDMGTADIQVPSCWVGWRATTSPGSYTVACSWPTVTPANRQSSYSVVELIP